MTGRRARGREHRKVKKGRSCMAADVMVSAWNRWLWSPNRVDRFHLESGRVWNERKDFQGLKTLARNSLLCKTRRMSEQSL